MKKKVTLTPQGGDPIPTNPVEKIIVKNEYDKLGQLVNKTLAPEFNSNAGLEQLNYDYNIRGWLTSLNKDFLSGNNPNKYFGMELAYDKTASVISGTSYTAAQYNGNIAGTSWKTKGDMQKRRYDFTYDNVNRLFVADFNQYTGGSFNKTANVDFTIKMGHNGILGSLGYDENGNIKQMTQYGLKINSSSAIDNLLYYYDNGEWSNRLMKVADFYSDPANKTRRF